MMFLTPIFDSIACCAEQIVQTGRQCVFASRLESTTSVFSSSTSLVVGAVLHEQRHFIEDQQHPLVALGEERLDHVLEDLLGSRPASSA